MPIPAPTAVQLRKLGYPMTSAGGVQMPPRPPINARPAPHADAFAAVRAMTGRQRVAAMYRGELTIQQLCKWAAFAPEQVAVVDGEFIFIAAELADHDTADAGTTAATTAHEA